MTDTFDDEPTVSLPSALQRLTHDEASLAAVLMDRSGIDLVEMISTDQSPASKTRCYRVMPFQWQWWRTMDEKQIDQGARCVREGLRVTTRGGPKAIETVEVGDTVLTHRGRWRRVTNVWDRGVQPVVRVSGRGADLPLDVTATHRFWARRPDRDPEWIPAGRLIAAGPTEWCITWPSGQQWMPVTAVRSVGTAPVWDLEVEDDHSFVVEGVAVHNSLGKCLAHGTLITTSDGHQHRIEELVGTQPEILAVNPMTLKTQPARAAAVYESGTKPVLTMTTQLGRHLTASVDHRILTRTGWRNLGHLAPGDHIASAHCSTNSDVIWDPVVGITPNGVEATCDITMEGPPNFLANGLVVHNSESIIAQAMAFPFNFPGQEFLIVTPEGSHSDALTERLEVRIWESRLMREMLQAGGGRRGITHHPFQATYANGARIMVRLPQRSGLGVKGCIAAGALVLTRGRGLVPIEDVVAGEEVWSHLNRWTPVMATESFEDDVYRVAGPGTHPILVNGDHHFWGRWDNSPHPGKSRRDLGAHTWAYVDDLARLERINFYWSGPGSHAFPDTPLVEQMVAGFDLTTSEPWWLIGRWLADGFLSSQKCVHWVATPKQSPDITRRLDLMGLKWTAMAHSSADAIEHGSAGLAEWLAEHFGEDAHGKHLPAFVFTMPRLARESLLRGYLSGDGSTAGKDRIVASSVSKPLSVGIGVLAQGLGLGVSFGMVQPQHRRIMGKALKSKPSWRVSVTDPGHSRGVTEGGWISYKVKTVEPAGRATVYNLVTEDHSYLADGIFHHNTHPVVLHIDEAQDISARTWAEIPEIVRTDVPGHQTRAHGVSKGIQDDDFYRKTQPDSGWVVHRKTKMHRPDLEPYKFIDEQGEAVSFTTNDRATADSFARNTGLKLVENWRDKQAREYGGRESPDFKRNVYGVHGAAMNRIFILTRLMNCTDTNEGSEYNVDEYSRFLIKADAIAARAETRSGRHHDVEVFDDDQAAALIEMVDLPRDHTDNYQTFWMGSDIGVIGDPTEILVFAEYVPKGPERARDKTVGIGVPAPGVTMFKLLTRVQLLNVAPDLQAHLIMHLINHYRPKAFSLDRTGNGISILRALQRMAGTARVYVLEEAEAGAPDEEVAAKARNALTTIKGYNFGEKIVIEIDERVVEERRLTNPQEILDQAGVRQNVKDAATDVLRELVDARRLRLPYDGEVINQMNGATWMTAQEPVDQWGRQRRIYARGEFHVLDAARMMALGMDKQPIEAIIAATRTPARPVLDRFGL